MSSAEEKIGECVVCCHRCGGFLMESASTTSYIVCPECGARLVVCVKKGKVSVFDDNRSEEELAKKRHARLTGYAAKLNKLGKQHLDVQLNIYEDARDKAIMLILSNINSYVNHKKSPLKCINAVLEPQGAPCDCNLVLNKPSCGI